MRYVKSGGALTSIPNKIRKLPDKYRVSHFKDIEAVFAQACLSQYLRILPDMLSVWTSEFLTLPVLKFEQSI